VEEGSRQFLPPEPAGPEPEMGGRPAPQPPQAYSAGQQQPPHAEPDNGPAVAGFVLSLVSGGLLVVSLGLSTIVSVACAVLGLVYSRRGKRRVESGETTRNAGLAGAGWIFSIIALVLSVLATILYTVVAILLATDDEFRNDFEREPDNSETIRACLRVAVALVI
jgi:hypothetical protein